MQYERETRDDLIRMRRTRAMIFYFFCREWVQAAFGWLDMAGGGGGGEERKTKKFRSNSFKVENCAGNIEIMVRIEAC